MLLNKIRNTIKRYGLINKNDRIVIGVSGGPDSLTLLYILNALKKDLNLKLHVAHLDHMLRKDSYKDGEFVRKLSIRLKIPFTLARVNIKKAAQKGSTEEVAREERHKFLFAVANKFKTRKIALGHNLDDQSETVLMRIIRGTGLYGLTGILPKRKISGFEIIRPLIEVRRREIEKSLKQKRISYITDESNSQDIYFRNKIRNRLLPLLEGEYNKNIREILSTLAESSGYDYDYLSYLAKGEFKKIKGRVNLNRFLKLHRSIQRLILRLAIAKIQGDTRRITFQHIKELEDLIFNRPLNSIVDLPKGIFAIKKPNRIIFKKR